MKTKRVNNDFHRLDVKLPIAVYEQVSEIAVNSFDAKIHHISNKPEITPTLIYLLELGIESFSNGNELSKKPNTDKYTDTIPITDNEVKELIKNALMPMHERLNDLVTVQSKIKELSEIVYRLTNTDKHTDNIYGHNLKNTIDIDSDTIIDTDSSLIASDNNLTNKNISIQSYISDNISDTKKNDITEKSTLSESPIMPLNEDLGVNVANEENKAINSDIQLVETEKDTSAVGSLTDAIDNVILPELAKDTPKSEIAKLLQGKYRASVTGDSTYWRTSLVNRAIDTRNKGKA